MLIQSNNLDIKGIPITTFRLNNDIAEKPTVFLIHGFQNDKYECYELGYRLAEKDIQAICVDAQMHGRRKDNDFFEQPLYKQFSQMFGIVRSTSRDIEIIIDYLKDRSECNILRIGVAGISMGGFIAFHQAVNNPFIKVAAGMISTPSLSELWYDLKNSTQPPFGGIMHPLTKTEDEFWTSYINEMDPGARIKVFAPKPLLIINGKYDMNVPVEMVQRMKIERHYEKNLERFSHLIYDVDHRVVSQMIIDTCNWFVEWL